MNRSSIALVLSVLFTGADHAQSADWKLRLRSQVETKPRSGQFHTMFRDERWKPAETALILCDFWDLHHCRNAVRRMEEFGPRLNALMKAARESGMVIIHAPSDCMPAYAEHPARQRAIAAPKSSKAPPDVDLWCSRIPQEEAASYPIDQSDGGEDDDPVEHAAWAAKLSAMGRNPSLPWKRQSDMIDIDGHRDYLSDRGDEVWNILEQRGVRNVILAGVHTNMCVLGRPFGLRQMIRGGKNVALLRDMTDTMYNPARWPWVSHVTANDLIVAHIERHVCPTITSDQFLGGQPFRFSGDRRPHVAIVIGENSYDTGRTLQRFAVRQLGTAFRISFVFASETDPHDLPGLEALNDADLLLLSVRRRALPVEQMAIVRRFIEAGKPVIGLRTASHAFRLKEPPIPVGHVTWDAFDAEVFGGNYQGHPRPKTPATLSIPETARKSALVRGLPTEPFQTGGSLYLTAPLSQGAEAILTGIHDGVERQPVAWTFQRKDGGRSFYTSLGEPADFENAHFLRLLTNAAYWAAGKAPPSDVKLRAPRDDYADSWMPFPVPASLKAGSAGVLQGDVGTVWYRCVVRSPRDAKEQPLTVRIPTSAGSVRLWWNGQSGQPGKAEAAHETFAVPATAIEAGDANLLVIRLAGAKAEGGLTEPPSVRIGEAILPLAGRWQVRVGDQPEWKNMPLPSKFGAATDIVFEHRK